MAEATRIYSARRKLTLIFGYAASRMDAPALFRKTDREVRAAARYAAMMQRLRDALPVPFNQISPPDSHLCAVIFFAFIFEIC
jgi:hypothetical protein